MRKISNINKQSCGRSMVEMLCVLMIMGVLTMVGIFGYGKAMDQLALNRQTQQLTGLFSGIVAFLHLNGTTIFTEDPMPLFTKLGYLPDNMINSNDASKPMDYFGYKYYFYDYTSEDYMLLVTNMTNPETCTNFFKNLQPFSAYIYTSGFWNDLYVGSRRCGVSSTNCLEQKTISDLIVDCKQRCATSCFLTALFYRH